MFKNYFKTAWRNLMKHKLFSFINIFGLASGMTVCMLALMHIKGAYDYDTFHPDADRSYRIITHLTRKNGEQLLTASSPHPLGAYLKDTYKAIDKTARVYFSYGDVAANNKNLYAKQAFANADFYNIFGFRLLAGSPATAPQTVVLTGETATRFFGTEDPIGKSVTLGTAGDFIVTGILAKPPRPSHLKFDLLASMPLLSKKELAEDWANEAAAYTYVQLKKGTSKEALENIVKQVTGEATRLIAPVTDKKLEFEPQALGAISPSIKRMYNTTGEPVLQNLMGFAAIGLVILLLAFFNYVNLTLARSLDRAREVGIRKVAGAFKRQLMLQFIGEAVFTACLAFGLALVLLQLISGLQIVQNLTRDVTLDATMWIIFALFAIATGLLAGWIPARVLSGFQPVQVLKGAFNAKLFGGVGLRKILTVIQFSVSLVAMVTLHIFYNQFRFMATADYGFNREQILNIPLQPAQYERTAAAYASIAGVEMVSATSGLFGFFGGDNRFIRQEKESDSLTASYFSVTPSYVHAMGLQLVAGVSISETAPGTATPAVMLNEEACRALKFKNPNEAVGKLVWTNDSTNYRITGVVKDFHFASFRRSMRPLLLVYNTDEFTNLSLAIAKGAEQTIVPKLEQAWKALYPHQPFEGVWFDKQLYEQHLHKDDLLFLGLLTGMALSIACLGLLGMVIYTTKNRSKEVGIRKVMGAGIGQIIVVISKDFIWLLGIAVCIGLPLGAFVGSALLQQYAYRIPVGIGILLASAAALLCLGSITIGWQTYRTASTNPVKSLRTE